MASAHRRFYYGWVVAGAASGIEFANAASAISILTLFVGPMTSELGWSRTQVAAATSLGAVLGAALAPFTGMLVDRRGSRLLLAAGGLVVALSCFYLATLHSLWGFYLGFTAARIADQGVIKPSASPTVIKWFRRYRGRAMGLVFFGGSAGIIVLAPLTQQVIQHWGWRTAWVGLGGLMLLLGVLPCALLMRRRPEDYGLAVDGGPANYLSRVGGADSAKGLSSDERTWKLGQIAHTPAFWLALAALLAVSTATSGVGLHLVPHLTQQGLSAGAAVGAVSVQAAAGASATLIFGLLAERLPPRWLMGLACLLAALSMALLARADSLTETYVFAVTQGAASGGIGTLAPILWASYYGRESMGAIYGLSRAAQVIGFALGPLISGMVYDATQSYQGALIPFAILAAGSAALLLASRAPQRQE
ncbi:MAG: MFS transporter [SAR202 cluster bacterium]|nr:MFS transporter [SAR202 cluster bacterium]